MVELDGTVLWGSEPSGEPEHQVRGLRFVDEDTLAVTTTLDDEVSTRIQDIDAG